MSELSYVQGASNVPLVGEPIFHNLPEWGRRFGRHPSYLPTLRSIHQRQVRIQAGIARRQLLNDGYGSTVFQYARLLAPSCDERDLARLQQLVELAYQYHPTSTLRTSVSRMTLMIGS